jgi:hypothetical protein
MRAPIHTMVVALLPVLGAAACETPVIQDPVPVTAVFSTAEGMQALEETIARLERMAADPWVSQRAAFDGTHGAASLEGVLSNLRAARERLQPKEATPPEGGRVMNGYGSPVVSGASWVSPTGGPGTIRNANYEAYTACYDCGNMDSPRGQMVIKQFAGSVLTFSQESTFGAWQAYATGRVVTTLTGPAQTGYITTHHWIDVFMSPDVHHYSSASGQV